MLISIGQWIGWDMAWKITILSNNNNNNTNSKHVNFYSAVIIQYNIRLLKNWQTAILK